MNEARRFLRYVFPGLVLILEVGIYLAICHTLTLRYYIVKFLTINGMAVTLLTLLASGGIGYFLGIVYNALYWTWVFDKCGVNHKEIIKDTDEQGWLKLCPRKKTNKINGPGNLSRAGAWRVITGAWYANEDLPEQATKRTDSLTDILHGLGAALIGSFLAPFIWFFLCLPFENIRFLIPGLPNYDCWAVISVAILTIVIIVFHYSNYLQTAKNVQGTIEIMICDMFRLDENKTNNKTKSIYVSSKDLEQRRPSVVVRFLRALKKMIINIRK